MSVREKAAARNVAQMRSRVHGMGGFRMPAALEFLSLSDGPRFQDMLTLYTTPAAIARAVSRKKTDTSNTYKGSVQRKAFSASGTALFELLLCAPRREVFLFLCVLVLLCAKEAVQSGTAMMKSEVETLSVPCVYRLVRLPMPALKLLYVCAEACSASKRIFHPFSSSSQASLCSFNEVEAPGRGGWR